MLEICSKRAYLYKFIELNQSTVFVFSVCCLFSVTVAILLSVQVSLVSLSNWARSTPEWAFRELAWQPNVQRGKGKHSHGI
jgi:hypothetical protein